jgi:hypothetical protein
MTDVALSVAVITAATGIVAASLPQAVGVISEGRRDRRARREREARDLREACLDILGAVGDLHARLSSAQQVHGEEMNARLAEINAGVAAVQRYAVGVALLAPTRLGDYAQALSAAAADLATAAAASTDPVAQQMVRPPDFSELDQAAAAFRAAAVAHSRAIAA